MDRRVPPTSRLREVALHVNDDPRLYYEFVGGKIPFPHFSLAGAFSFDSKLGPDSVAETDAKKFIEKPADQGDILVAVGGEYQKADVPQGTAAFSSDGGMKWTAAVNRPHDYRSSVAYDPARNYWITVGPNGTDISTDDGRNWQVLKPGPNDLPDADQHRNALSLPFAVGPQGRIGKLNATALTP